MFELEGVKFNWVPNQIDGDYWKKDEVRAWAEPILNRLQEEVFHTSPARLSGRSLTYGGDIVYALQLPWRLDFAANLLSQADTDYALDDREEAYSFEGNAYRAKAFLIAAGYHGLNPEAQGYGDLWNKQPAKQEAA